MGANKDALLNEYKGYLFEFLVARELISLNGLKPLEKSLSENSLSILQQQESFVRNEFPELLIKLPVLARHLAHNIQNFFGAIDDVALVGKQNSSLKNGAFSEGDILIKSQAQQYSLSIKLAKTGLPTNTKSSGLLSIFSKYFKAPQVQEKFNGFLETEFDMMARDLHDIYNIEYDSSFQQWKNNHLPLLPGELGRDARDRLHKYYHLLAGEIFRQLHSLQRKDSDFMAGLSLLAGFSNNITIQFICVYEDHYHLKEIRREDSDFIKDLRDMRLSKSSIIVEMLHGKIFMRVKPMNTFISKAYKLNIATQPF